MFIEYFEQVILSNFIQKKYSMWGKALYCDQTFTDGCSVLNYSTSLSEFTLLNAVSEFGTHFAWRKIYSFEHERVQSKLTVTNSQTFC